MQQLYFNENDPFAAQWLRNLYPEAHVDERDIRKVEAADVAGFRECHFFGGIGGWRYALDVAGWSEPVWTGSAPCQPFSEAGDRKGEADERHLWPEFRRIIAEHLPATIFGEQVASKLGREWLSRVRTDLEALGYAVGAADLCAACQGSPHPRQRLFWVAYRSGEGLAGRALESARQECQAAERSGDADGLGNANGSQRRSGWARQWEQQQPVFATGIENGGLANAECNGGRIDEPQRESESGVVDWRTGAVALSLSDGSVRRAPIESGIFPLAHGIPRDLGRRFPELRQLAKRARNNRVGRLRGYGNAIVPQVAAVFIRAFMEVQAVKEATE